MADIKFKRSAVAGKVPATTDLELGQLAINTFDGKLFIKKDNGTPAIVEVGAGGGGSMIYPGSGIAVSSGSSWSTSLTPPSGDVVGTTDTQTLSSKRIVSRAIIQTSNSFLSWNSNNYDQYSLTALASSLTMDADSGSPTEGQKMLFRIKDNGTARGFGWLIGSAKGFRPVGVTLPTTTVPSKVLYIGCIFNSTDNIWDVVAVSREA